MARPNGFVIAIDGPSGAGKSTVARLLAKRIGYSQIDTGAMYRAAAWLISQAGIAPDDGAALTRLLKNADIRLEHTDGCHLVIANGRDVTALIRTPEMSLLTSQTSTLAPVREALMRAQRAMGQDGGVVLEGRDIGTVVFPDAELKFYLFASPEERGRRRHAELAAKGNNVTLAETIEDVIRRDAQDSQRDLAPLKQADDAIPIDSSNISSDEVLDRMEHYFRSLLSGTGK